jgi:DNA-binding transcriptional LysR family regulator
VPGGLRPTARATELFERAVAVEQAVTGLSASITRATPELGGVVRVATSMTFAVEMLPEVLARLLAEHPQLQLELLASDSVSNLLRREADIAVRFVRPNQPDVVAVRAGELPIGLYAHRDYLARHGPPLRPEDWARHSLIGMEDPAVTLQDAAALGVRLERSNVRFRSDTYLAQVAALRAGAGIGACQVWLADRYPELVRLDRNISLPSLPLWVAAHDDLHRSRRIRVVFDAMVEAGALRRVGHAREWDRISDLMFLVGVRIGHGCPDIGMQRTSLQSVR